MKVTRRTGSLVIVLVIFAAIVLGTALAAIAIDKSEIPMLQQHAAEAAVTADGYTHGSNIGREISGTATAISTAGDLRNALNGSGTYYLTQDIELSAQQSFRRSGTFSGTLYGNGYTVTVTGPLNNNTAAVTGIPNGTAIGGLVGTLTGRIYDLNVVMASGTSAAYLSASGNYEMRVGLIAGILDGGTGDNHGAIIENCTVTIPSGSKLGGLSYTKHDDYKTHNGANVGAIAGNANSSFTIRNVTVTNNGHILAGKSSSTTASNSYSLDMGFSSMLVGLIWNDNANYQQDIDNIIAKGSGTVEGYVVSILGATYVASGSTIYPLSINNYYNQFIGIYSYGNDGGWPTSRAFVSYTLFKWHSNDGSTLTNYYHSSGTNQSMMSSGYYVAPTNSITVSSNEYTVGFDPKATDTSKSLVVVKSVDNGGANYRATITGVNNNSYSDGYYAFNSTGDTVVFRNLPTAASNWSSNGTFTCNITTTQTETPLPTYDTLTKWEHGYVSADTTTSGTAAISTGTQFENIFRPNGSLNQSGTYYLTDDIAITGFTGKTFGGTLDGNGHTIFITDTHTGMTGPHIGGLVGTLSGTIKNVRVVLMLPDNTQVTCTNGKGDDFVIGFGGVVGKINGGTVENVNVVIPSGYTFSAGWGGSGSDVGVGGIAGSMIGSGTVTNCTVQVDGDIRASSGWPFASGIVGATGKEQSYSDYPFRFTNIILKGIGTIGGTTTDSSNTTQPTFAAAITITPPITGKTISIDGFIYNMTGENGPTWGSGGGAGSGYGKVSSWGYVCQNNDNGRPTAGVGLSADGKISYSNIYDMGSLMYDTVAENGFTSGGDLIWYDTTNHDGNVYYNMTRTAEIKSTVAESTIPVTPYFPASSNGNLVLVAGDGTVTVPDLRYTNNAGTAFNSTADGNYKVVTVAKGDINTATVTLEEPVAVIVTVDPMNQWEHGYVSDDNTTTSGTAIGSAEEFEKYFSPSGNGSLSNGTYYLTGDITIKGFTGKTFSGTLDGNGHTIYIAATNTGMTGKPIGGLVGELTGKIKNVRVVIGNNVTVGTTATGGSGSYPMIGGIVGYLNGGTLENVQVVVPKDITFATQQFSSNLAFGGMVGEMNNATLTKVTAVIDGTLAPYGSYVWAAALVGKQAQNGTASTLTDVIVRGEGTFNATSSNSGGTHEDAFLAAVTVFQESSNAKRATVNGVIIDFTPTLNACDCYGIFTNNNYGGGSGADYSNIVEASNIYVINQTANENTSGNKVIDESAVTKSIAETVKDRNDIPVTPYFPASSNGNLVLVAGNGKDSVTTPLAYNNGTDSFVSEAVTVGSAEYQVVTVAKKNVTTGPVSLEIAAVNDPVIATPSEDLVYNGQSGIDVTIGTLKYGSDVLELGKDYTITIAAVAGGTGSVEGNKPVNAGEYTLTVTLTKHNFADGNNEKVLNFTVSPKAVTVTVTAVDREYDGTTNVTLSGGELFGVVSGDSVTANLGTGTAAQAGVGTGISVTVNVTLTGAHAANYVLQSQPTVTVNITPKVLSFTAGTTSFPFANTMGTAITEQNLTDGVTYSVNVTGFVETDPEEDKAYTLEVSTVSGTTPTYVTDNTNLHNNYLAKGEYTVTLTTPVSGNYTFGSNNTFTFYVTKNENANTWLTEYARGDWTYYSNPTAETTPVARFGSPAITYSNGNEGFSNTTAKGTYTVNVSVAETDNYGALTKEYSFTVSALDVTVALSAAGTVYDGQAYEADNITITLTATVNGKETTYTSKDNPDDDVSALLGSYGWQHSVDGGETETKEDHLPTDAGTYTLYICNYSSNKNVNVTGTLNCTATISPAEVTFSAETVYGAELVYGTFTDTAAAHDLVAVTAEGYPDLPFDYSVQLKVAGGIYSATTDAGTTVTLTVQVSVTDPNHTAVQPAETLTLEIQKADIGEISVTNFGSVTIDFTSYKGFVYGQAKTLEFSGIPADLTVTPVYTYVKDGAQIDNFDILTANSGIYTVTVSITGDTNYNDKTSKTIEFAIARAEQSVNVSIGGWTYGEEASTLQIDGIKESAVTTVTYSGTTNAGDEYNSEEVPTIVPTEAGTYTVTVSWAETTNYTAGSAKSEEFTIARATGFAKISVNGTPYTKTVTAYYTGSAQPFKVTVEGHGGEIYIDGNHSSTMNFSLTDAGTTTVKVTVAQTANYTESTATTVEIEILPAVIQSVTLKTTKFAFGTLNTENANDAATYGTADVAFVEYKGSVSPEFTYSLSYSKTENGNDEKAYIVVGEEYILTLALTGETAANFVFDGNTSTTAVTVQVTKGKNTWTSQDEIDDYPFGFEGKPVTGTAKFGTAAVTYYRGNVMGQANKGEAIAFSFDQRAQDAGTYTAVVSVPANDNYDEIYYEYTFAVKKHGLNITITKLTIKGTEVSGSAADGYTVTYAPEMGYSAEVSVGSAEKDYNGSVPELLGNPTTRTYLFEYSVADSNVWNDGFPQSAGNYDVRVKGMKLAAGYNIDNFEFVSVPSVKLTIDPAKITVTAYIPENAAVVYGMTTDEIRNLIKLDPEEGVTLGEVKVTYDNGTEYNNTVAAGKKLTISVVSVKAENKNYIAEFVGGVLTPIVQQATLHVDAEDSSVLSANFDPDEFNEFKMYDAITAKWNGKIVTASDYFDVTLTGYKGEVTGMTAEENFANKEIGTYTFTVTLKDDYAVNFVTDPETIVYKLTLGQSIVTLTVSIGNWTYGGTAAKPTFTVTASDGKEIDIRTIGQYITINYSNDSGYDSPDQPTDAGTYTLTANIVGHHDYVAENAATAEFTISPAEVKFGAKLAEGAELVYGIVPKDFNSLVTVTASGGINLGADGWGYTVTAAGDYTATTNAGTTVTLTVKFFVTDPNHTTVQPDKTLALEIQKADQSVTVKISGWTYKETENAPVIEGIKEGATTTVSYSGTTNAGEEYDSATAPKEAGTYTVTVSWKETTNYTAGSAAPVPFTVEKAKLTKPTANGNTFTYTGAEQTYIPEDFDAATMTISGNVQTNAGNYTVTVSVKYKYNYVWADDTDTDITFTFVIAKAEQLVNVTISGWTYGDTAKDYEIVGIMESAATTAVYSGTTNAGVKYDSETAPTAAGSYTVTVSWAETTNYTAGSAAPVAFTVEKAKLTKPTANVDPFVYTGAAQTYTPDGFNAATMTIAGNVQTNADTYTVTVSVTDKYNYVWADDTDTDITFNFVIGKAEQSVNVSIDGWTYGDTAKEYSVEGIMENAGYTVNYSGDGYSADTAPVNAGNYTLKITVDATANYNAAVASAEFTIAPKELHVSDSVMIIEVEYGELTLDDISSYEAIMAVIGDYTAIFDGLVYDDVLTPDDFTLTAAKDYSGSVADGFMAVADYSIKVALNDSLTNYVVPESGLENITFRVVKAANSIGRYSVSGWTYLDVRSEYIPAFSAAAFGTVVGSFFDENGTEIAVDDFGATTPAGTYTFRLSVAETDNYTGATRTGSFVVDKLIVVAELTATDVTYDGAVYDGISYTLSFDVSDYIGTVGYEYSENGSAFRKGLPTDAGNYSVRIGEYSDSENIELRAETVDFQINPAPMHFTVTGVDGASIEYGTAIADIDVNALIVSVIPDSYVGDFEFTVSLITANGTAYRPGLYAGTTLYATVDITLDSNNYYPVVDTAIEMLPKVNITKVSHDMAFEISDEIITDGSSAAVIEGSANTVIDAISYYMSINDIQYYEYHITVDGEEYSRNFNWAPGTHTVEVRLSGNHEGSAQFTVVIEENPDAVDRAPFTPKTVVGEVLESINFTWASAVSIAFGVAVAVLIILFFGLRRAKRK